MSAGSYTSSESCLSICFSWCLVHSQTPTTLTSITFFHSARSRFQLESRGPTIPAKFLYCNDRTVIGLLWRETEKGTSDLRSIINSAKFLDRFGDGSLDLGLDGHVGTNGQYL